MGKNKKPNKVDNEHRHSNCPIFVVGVPRSGTTLLQAMLNSHPDIVIAPETHFFSKFWALRYHYGSLANPSSRNNFIEDYTDSSHFRDLQFENKLHIKEILSKKATTYGRFFDIMIREYMKKYPEKTVCGEKTPAHLYYMEEIKKFFPEARFIHIIRDPRAVYHSITQTSWGKDWMPQELAMRWNRYMKKTSKFKKKYPDSIRNILYRDLLHNPERELRKICSFCSVEFHPSMLDYHKKSINYLGEMKKWKPNLKKPIDVSLIDRWKSKLSKDVSTLIVAICINQMGKNGFVITEFPKKSALLLQGLRYKAVDELIILTRKLKEIFKNILFSN